MGIRISAIICTHNRAEYLKKTIKSLINQTLPKEEYEVIVVDNSSTANTKQVIDQLRECQSTKIPEQKIDIRYVYEAVLGLSRARNTGWRNAKGEYVAYLDDDAIASNDWLEKILDFFKTVDPKPGCIGGKVEPIWEVPRPAWLSDKLLGQLTILDWGPEPLFLDDEQWFVGANMAFPKVLLKEIGGFQVKLGRIGNKLLSMEEILLRKEIEEKGYRCFYHPEVSVKHHILPHRLTKKWFQDRAYWNGVSSGYIQIYQRFPSIPVRLWKGIKTILRILLSPREFSCLVLSIENPDCFADKCSALARIGHVAALWGLVR